MKFSKEPPSLPPERLSFSDLNRKGSQACFTQQALPPERPFRQPERDKLLSVWGSGCFASNPSHFYCSTPDHYIAGLRAWVRLLQSSQRSVPYCCEVYKNTISMFFDDPQVHHHVSRPLSWLHGHWILMTRPEAQLCWEPSMVMASNPR